jgi:hypothetical protein
MVTWYKKIDKTTILFFIDAHLFQLYPLLGDYICHERNYCCLNWKNTMRNVVIVLIVLKIVDLVMKKNLDAQNLGAAVKTTPTNFFTSRFPDEERICNRQASLTILSDS